MRYLFSALVAAAALCTSVTHAQTLGTFAPNSVLGSAVLDAPLASKADSTRLDAKIARALAAKAAKQTANGDASGQHVTSTSSFTPAALQDVANKLCITIGLFGADPTGVNASDAGRPAKHRRPHVSTPFQDIA